MVVQGSALLKLGHPEVAQRNAAALAPIANGLETVGDVTRPPVLNTPIRQCDEPDMLAVAVGYG